MTTFGRLTMPALALALSAGAAVADSDGWRGYHGPGAGPGRDMSGMMGMMMQMHGVPGPGMMGGGLMAPGMMGGGAMGGMAMMSALDENSDGSVAPEEACSVLSALLDDYDADGDGTLSLSEFEALHSALIRETTVDRFQHLDADGDGRVTGEEMQAPADRIARMQALRERMMEDGSMPFGMMPGQGPMMDGRSGMMGGTGPGMQPDRGN